MEKVSETAVADGRESRLKAIIVGPVGWSSMHWRRC